MRTLVLVGLLTLALLAPGASAAGFTFLAGRHLEATPGATRVATYEMPLRIEEDGLLYAKLLATDGNAVHDGRRANGSVEDGTGWRLELALRGASGEVQQLGAFVDGTPTSTMPVKAGDEMALLMTLRVPSDAPRFGERQLVYVALAFRLASAEGAGTSSGASMDQARAITLIVHLPSEGGVPVETPTDPVEGGEAAPGTPTSPTTPTTPTAEATGGEDPTGPGETTDPGPVAPIATPQGGTVRVVVEQQAMPLWFMLGALAIATAVLFALVATLLVMWQVLREMRAAEPARAARPLRIETAPARSEEPSRVAPPAER